MYEVYVESPEFKEFPLAFQIQRKLLFLFFYKLFFHGTFSLCVK